MRKSYFVIGCCCVLSIWGCQTLSRPVSETAVDQELTITPTPNTPPLDVTHEDPREGFKQESPKSQAP